MQLSINGKVAAIVAASAVACSGLGLAVSEAVSSPGPQHAALMPKVVPKVVTPPPKIIIKPKINIQQQNNNNAPAAPAPPTVILPAPAPLQPAPQGLYADIPTLSLSIETEIANQEVAVPASVFISSNHNTVYVTLTSNGTDDNGDQLYTATGYDTDGDTGYGDNITVAPDSSSWSDTGMTWTGPDIPTSWDWTTTTAIDYTGPNSPNL